MTRASKFYEQPRAPADDPRVLVRPSDGFWRSGGREGAHRIADRSTPSTSLVAAQDNGAPARARSTTSTIGLRARSRRQVDARAAVPGPSDFRRAVRPLLPPRAATRSATWCATSPASARRVPPRERAPPRSTRRASSPGTWSSSSASTSCSACPTTRRTGAPEPARSWCSSRSRSSPRSARRPA